MPRIILFLTLVITVFNCKTTSSNRNSDSAQTASQASSTNGLGLTETPLLAPPPVSGASLTVLSISAEETHRDNLAVMQITVNKDTNADYARMWVCALGSTSDCTPTAANPMETASGIFNLFVIPSKSFTIYAQSCVDAASAYSPQSPCGQVQTQDFVSSVSPLNPEKETATLLAIQGEQNKIRTQCSEIRKALKDYLSGNPGSSDLATLAQNQLSLTNVQLCGEFMGSDYYNVVKNAVNGTASPSETNTAIALGLGTVSVLALATGIHGTWRLRNAINDRNNIQALITDAEANIKELTQTIATESQLLKQLKGEIKSLGEQSKILEEWINAGSEADRQALEAQHAELGNLQRTTQEALTQKIETVIDLNTKQSIAQAQIESLNARITEKSKELDEKTTYLKSLQDEFDSSRKAANTYTDLLSKKQDLIRELEAKAKELHSKSMRVSTERYLEGALEDQKFLLKQQKTNFRNWEANRNSAIEAINSLYETTINIKELNDLMYDGTQAEVGKYGKNPADIPLNDAYNNRDKTKFPKLTRRQYFHSLPPTERSMYYKMSLDWIQKNAVGWGIYSSDPLPYPFTEPLLEKYSETLTALEKAKEEYLTTAQNFEKASSEEERVKINNEIERLKTDLASPNYENLADKISLLETEITQLQQAINTKPKELENITKIRKNLAQLTTDRRTLEQKILSTKKLKADLAKTVKDLQSQVGVHSQNEALFKAELERANAELGQTEDRAAELEKQLQLNQKTKDGLDQNILTARETLAKNTESTIQKREQVDKSRLSKATARVEINKVETDLKKYNPQLESKMKTVTGAKMQAGFGALIGIGAGVGAAYFANMNLVGDSQSELTKALNDAVTKIEESRNAIDTYWQQLSEK